MSFIDNVLDRAADKVQTFTGEKKRKELVKQLKDRNMEFKEIVGNDVNFVNEKILILNQLIQKLNNWRSNQLKHNINNLQFFLGKFGNIQVPSEYAEEKSTRYLTIPKKEFEIKETYLSRIDWSEEEVFLRIISQGVLETKKQTKEQNISMIERLETFKLEIEATKHQ